MSDLFEEFLIYLSLNPDAQDIEDVSEGIGVEAGKLRKIVEFLAKYDFIRCKSEQIQIDPQLRELYLYD